MHGRGLALVANRQYVQHGRRDGQGDARAALRVRRQRPRRPRHVPRGRGARVHSPASGSSESTTSASGEASGFEGTRSLRVDLRRRGLGGARVARAVEVRAVATTTRRIVVADSAAARIGSAGSRCGRPTNEPGLGGCQGVTAWPRCASGCCGWPVAACSTSASRGRFVSTMRRSSSSVWHTPCCLRSWSSRPTRATTTRKSGAEAEAEAVLQLSRTAEAFSPGSSSASRAYWSATAAR